MVKPVLANLTIWASGISGRLDDVLEVVVVRKLTPCLVETSFRSSLLEWVLIVSIVVEVVAEMSTLISIVIAQSILTSSVLAFLTFFHIFDVDLDALQFDGLSIEHWVVLTSVRAALS